MLFMCADGDEIKYFDILSFKHGQLAFDFEFAFVAAVCDL